MHLVIIGCEYSGTTTLAAGIKEWADRTMGLAGDRKYHFHDHWKIPHIRHGLPVEEQEQILALSPYLKESYQRFHLADHMQDEYYLLGAEETGDLSEGNHLVVGMHIDEAVYAPLYYGYGAGGYLIRPCKVRQEHREEDDRNGSRHRPCSTDLHA